MLKLICKKNGSSRNKVIVYLGLMSGEKKEKRKKEEEERWSISWVKGSYLGCWLRCWSYHRLWLLFLQRAKTKNCTIMNFLINQLAYHNNINVKLFLSDFEFSTKIRIKILWCIDFVNVMNSVSDPVSDLISVCSLEQNVSGPTYFDVLLHIDSGLPLFYK